MRIMSHLNRRGKWEGVQREQGKKILHEKVEYSRHRIRLREEWEGTSGNSYLSWRKNVRASLKKKVAHR